MEGIIYNKITPLLKCMVLFLFIFTAKVLTSRPHETQEIKNGIHQLKPLHYVRTFTKYHHRRTIQWNQNNDQDINNYWPVINDQPKVIGKRSVDNSDYIDSSEVSNNYDKIIIKKLRIPFSKSESVDKHWQPHTSKIVKRTVDIPNSNEFLSSSHDLPKVDQLSSQTARENIVNAVDKKVINSGKTYNVKNGIPDNIKTYKVKAAVIPTAATTTMGPTISCLYKMHNSVTISVTPSYADEKNAQLMVEIDGFETGPISKSRLPNGEYSQVEHCTDTRASCYTLWHQTNEGNITILGQGCWRSATESRKSCDKCTKVTAVPGTKFCCCTKQYCNADFLALKEEIVTTKAEATVNTTSPSQNSTSNLIAAAILFLVVILVMTLLVRKFCCVKLQIDKDIVSEGPDLEKGDVMGIGPEALATGLACVDNLTLIEHIGQGKFGSVWRGSLGSTPVAVKLYSNTHTWQREASMYALPHLAHPNILRYYGSDNRTSLDGGCGSKLIVVELCSSSLRSRLQDSTLTWQEFAHLAHGLAAALAHLHTPSGSKPCVVHRDVNSNNVLVTSQGDARLADLGLAQLLHPKRDRTTPTRITEAGTLRYLAPEALEGALDLSGALAALCAVDVFALGLVLWEMLWRTKGAHAGPVPPYAPPYQHAGLSQRPTLAQMQTLVSRNKARPPLPKGPIQSRALKIAADTCDECWDHDAEARLTAMCVEERMAELEQRLHCQGPLIHDNIHPHTHPPTDSNSPQETDKNSNCTSTQNCDVHTPLLYPQPHMGRNACIERNTHSNTQQITVELIHKSLKDITAPIENHRVPSNEENCLSVARISRTRIPVQENSGFNEIRSYQRPLEYVPNDVTSHEDRGPKQTNLLQDVKIEKAKWGIKKFFEKLNRNKLETEVKLAENSQRILTSIVDKPTNNNRPSNLNINQDRGPFNFEGPCTLSPPNKTLSPTMMRESDKVFGFKELPSRDDAKTPNQIFAVIVPKGKPPDLLEMQNKRGSSDSLNKRSVNTSNSSHSMLKSNSESEDSTVKKRLSCDQQIIDSGNSSKASINLELQYIDNPETYNGNISPFDINSDCSSSEDEHLLLLSENGGSKITMQTITKPETDKKKYQNDVLKESSQVTDFTFNKFQNKYTNFDNEFSDPNDKENLVNGYSGDNPVYLAALNGEIDTADLKYSLNDRSTKPNLKNLLIKRQHSLEQVGEIFSSSGEVNLLNPAGRVKTPGDLPVAVRRARRDRALQKGRASECNRLSLYDDRMMFGNSL